MFPDWQKEVQTAMYYIMTIYYIGLGWCYISVTVEGNRKNYYSTVTIRPLPCLYIDLSEFFNTLYYTGSG